MSIAPFTILIANGVNLDLLGKRQPEIYGTVTLATLEEDLTRAATGFCNQLNLPMCALTFFQTNDESQFLQKLSGNFSGAVLNPGAWTHTSLALADRLVGLELPFVEVHLSNLARREPFRRKSWAAPHACGIVHGLGLASYEAGLWGLLRHLCERVVAQEQA